MESLLNFQKIKNIWLSTTNDILWKEYKEYANNSTYTYWNIITENTHNVKKNDIIVVHIEKKGVVGLLIANFINDEVSSIYKNTKYNKESIYIDNKYIFDKPYESDIQTKVDILDLCKMNKEEAQKIITNIVHDKFIGMIDKTMTIPANINPCLLCAKILKDNPKKNAFFEHLTKCTLCEIVDNDQLISKIIYGQNTYMNNCKHIVYSQEPTEELAKIVDEIVENYLSQTRMEKKENTTLYQISNDEHFYEGHIFII